MLRVPFQVFFLGLGKLARSCSFAEEGEKSVVIFNFFSLFGLKKFPPKKDTQMDLEDFGDIWFVSPTMKIQIDRCLLCYKLRVQTYYRH